VWGGVGFWDLEKRSQFEEPFSVEGVFGIDVNFGLHQNKRTGLSASASLLNDGCASGGSVKYSWSGVIALL
jgi:hypothetical protein